MFLLCSINRIALKGHNDLNWDAAIETHRLALLRLMAVMYAAVGVEAGGSVETVRRNVRLMVLRVLGPMESALRRLVFLKARDLPDVEFQRGPARDKSAKRSARRSKSKAFQLFDRQRTPSRPQRKHPKGTGPRIFFFDGFDAPPAPVEPPASPDDPVSGESLCARLNALFAALSDLEKQAHRLKRAEARRKLSPRFWGEEVVRKGSPPGHRKKGRSPDESAADTVLKDCHDLALWWTAERDTS